MKKKINRQEIIDKLCQYDVYMIMKNINMNDYDWLSYIREYGFKGYTNYTDQELIIEWEDSEDGYNSMIADDEQPYEITNTMSVSRVPCQLEQDTKAFGGRT
jgi:hypothetical protein